MTEKVIFFVFFLKISTHTLTWSVTLLPLSVGLFSVHFNSHAHVERDPAQLEPCGHDNISTHTLTWSVTVSITTPLPVRYISTHTLTWSVTISAKLGGNKLEDFNSHAHVERDPVFEKFRPLNANFNSHAHVERDPATADSFAAYYISTHTLTWSVTNSCFS